MTQDEVTSNVLDWIASAGPEAAADGLIEQAYQNACLASVSEDPEQKAALTERAQQELYAYATCFGIIGYEPPEK